MTALCSGKLVAAPPQRLGVVGNARRVMNSSVVADTPKTDPFTGGGGFDAALCPVPEGHQLRTTAFELQKLVEFGTVSLNEQLLKQVLSRLRLAESVGLGCRGWIRQLECGYAQGS